MERGLIFFPSQLWQETLVSFTSSVESNIFDSNITWLQKSAVTKDLSEQLNKSDIFSRNTAEVSNTFCFHLQTFETV